MDQAVVVNDLKGGERLDRKRDGLPDRHRPAQNPIGKRLAVEQLHRDEERIAFLADLEDLTDVRMVDCRRGSRLVDKPPPRLAILGRRDELQCNLAIQTDVARAIDLAHPSGAEEREDFIRREARTRCDRHRGAISRA